jgi:hypothetical protein
LNVAKHLTPEEVHAFRKKVVDQCTLDISRATIPFFAFHNNQVVLFGSGTLLQIADRHFIVSAAHVLDYPAVHGIPTMLSPGTDGGKFIPLDRTRVYTTPIPKGRREGPAMREGDDDDVGVCELPAEIAEQLCPARRFVRLDEVSRRKGFQQGFYMVIGYPVSLSRPLDQEPALSYKT